MTEGRAMTAQTRAARSAADQKIENAADAAVTVDAAIERRSATLAPFRWRRGQSGNPGGRYGVLARRVREATRDGADLIAFLVTVVNDGSERTRDRLHAAEMLLSRGWGKALQPLALQALIEDRRAPNLMPNLSSLSNQDLQLLLEILGRAKLPAPEPEQ